MVVLKKFSLIRKYATSGQVELTWFDLTWLALSVGLLLSGNWKAYFPDVCGCRGTVYRATIKRVCAWKLPSKAALQPRTLLRLKRGGKEKKSCTSSTGQRDAANLKEQTINESEKNVPIEIVFATCGRPPLCFLGVWWLQHKSSCTAEYYTVLLRSTRYVTASHRQSPSQGLLARGQPF